MFISSTQLAKISLLICLLGECASAGKRISSRMTHTAELECAGFNEVYTDCNAECDTTCDDVLQLRENTACKTFLGKKNPKENSDEEETQEDSREQFDKSSDETEEEEESEEEEEEEEQEEEEDDDDCKEGCVCKKGTARNSDGICIPENACSNELYGRLVVDVDMKPSTVDKLEKDMRILLNCDRSTAKCTAVPNNGQRYSGYQNLQGSNQNFQRNSHHIQGNPQVHPNQSQPALPPGLWLPVAATPQQVPVTCDPQKPGECQQSGQSKKYAKNEDEVVLVDCDDNDPTKCVTHHLPKEVQELILKQRDMVMEVEVTTPKSKQKHKINKKNTRNQDAAKIEEKLHIDKNAPEKILYIGG